MCFRHKNYKRAHFHKGIIFGIFLSGLLFASCSGTRRLKEGELLLTQNKIKIDGVGFSERIFLGQELNTLLRQRPNTRYLLTIKRNLIYDFLESRKNKKVLFRNTLSKQAEPPAVLDTLLVAESKRNMINYLYNKGYFKSEISHSIKVNKSRKAKISYSVRPGLRSQVDSLIFHCVDTAVYKLLQSSRENSFLKPGSPIDNFLFQSEKTRITDLMQENGYAEFNPIYIDNLELDTFNNKNSIHITIFTPAGKNQHARYYTGNIEIIPDYNPQEKRLFARSSMDSILFANSPSKNSIRNKVLLEKIHPRPGNLFNKSDIDQTYLDLAGLNFYKFINIDSRIDSSGSNRINHSIFLSPHKKWSYDFGTDLNYTTVRTTGRNLFGISGFYYLKNRNTFGGGEIFDFKIEAGAELNFLDTFGLNSITISYLNSLTLPSFRDLTGSVFLARKLLSPLYPIPKKPNTHTSLVFLVDYINLNSIFSYVSLSSSIKYDFQINKRKRLTLNTFEINYYTPLTISGDFNRILESNPFLKASFTGKRLFTSFLFSSAQYVYQARKSRIWENTSIFTLDLSGAEAALINTTGRLFNSDFSVDSLRNIEFSKFIKIEGETRWYYHPGAKNTIAMRTGAGIALPYGKSKGIPYIKQFFLGGPQSMRAWGIREPGPGKDTISRDIDQRGNFYSAGDIKMEANIEWRFDLAWIFKGALFADAGNVWLLPDETKAASQFTRDFYKQIGFGAGLGLRMDLSFFIFRLDWGFKLRNTYPDEKGNYWIPYGSYDTPLSQMVKKSNLHLALNYPF